jgi:hypothetical protein
MDRGSVAERKMLMKICREYHPRIPWTVPDHEEPVLSEWNPEAPILLETLPEDQEALKLARVKLLNAVSATKSVGNENSLCLSASSDGFGIAFDAHRSIVACPVLTR